MTSIGVNATTIQRLTSLTARGKNGYRQFNRNWFSSLALADEFSRSNRGKKSTVRGCISLRRRRSAFGLGKSNPVKAEARARSAPEGCDQLVHRIRRFLKDWSRRRDLNR